MTQQSHLQVFIQKNWKQDLKEICAHSCLLQDFYNNQEMQAAQMSIDIIEWIKKMW